MDAQNFRKGVLSLGARRKDIRDEPDLKYADFSELFGDLREELQENERNNEHTFLLLYYAGHGLQDTMSLAACNEDKNYPIEK